MEDVFRSVLHYPNLQGLLIPLEKTNAYAVTVGRFNEERIKMRPKERWCGAANVSRADEFTIDPTDVSAWFPGEYFEQQNCYMNTQAYVYWFLEFGHHV